MATRRERPVPLPTSATPFRDALRRVLERRYGMPWREALELLRAGVKPSSRRAGGSGR